MVTASTSRLSSTRAEVRFRLRIAAIPLPQERQGAGEVPLVDVHDVTDPNVCDSGEMFVVILPAAPVFERKTRRFMLSTPFQRGVS